MIPSDKLLAIIESLPPNERERLEEYIELITKEATLNAVRGEMKFNWAGGLSEYRGKFNSVTLQKKAMEWMSGVSH